MAEDERRVEPRTALVGRGVGTTPERIDELAQRAKELEKLTRKKPEKEFGALLVGAKAREPSPKARRDEALPKKGPRPGLAHPAQREVYGREEDEAPVVLKG